MIRVPIPVNQMPAYRIGVSGWRNWPYEYEWVVHWALHGHISALRNQAGQWQRQVIIVDGACPYGGVDKHASNWAINNQDKVVSSIQIPAEWGVFGKAAGPKRNQAMVNMGLDHALIFPAAESTGTIDFMIRAMKAMIPMDVTVFNPARFDIVSRGDNKLQWARL